MYHIYTEEMGKSIPDMRDNLSSLFYPSALLFQPITLCMVYVSI